MTNAKFVNDAEIIEFAKSGKSGGKKWGHPNLF